MIAITGQPTIPSTIPPADDADQPTTDEQLMASVSLLDDVEAFTELFRRWHKRLLGYFRRRLSDESSADDLASETLFRVFHWRKSFDGNRPFHPWFWRIARNSLYAFWKAGMRKSMPIAAEFATAAVASREPGCDSRLIGEETRDAVELIVCRLPDTQFNLLRRRYWEESEIQGIAETDGVTHQAVSLRLHKCHAFFRSDARLQRAVFGEVAIA